MCAVFESGGPCSNSGFLFASCVIWDKVLSLSVHL